VLARPTAFLGVETRNFLVVPAKAGTHASSGEPMREHQQGLERRIVRVIDGPFTGFRGEVREVDERTVKVAVQAYGRVTPVDLALSQLELVPENSN
jgi:transcription antitermination factor NusG